MRLLGVTTAIMTFVGCCLACDFRETENVIQAIEANSFDRESFDNLNLEVSIEASGSVKLCSEDRFGAVGQAWWQDQIRAANGFIANFGFSIDGTGDGIAFVVQSFGVSNTYGGTGSQLGYENKITNFLGVSFFSCVDHPTCTAESVSIITHSGTNPNQVASAPLPFSIQGGTHEAQVSYFENNTLVVFLDGEFVLLGENIDLQGILGGAFGHVGFSASTRDQNSVANILLTSLDVVLAPFSHRVVGLVGQEVIWGMSVNFSVAKFIDCGNQIDIDPTASVSGELLLTIDDNDPDYNSSSPNAVKIEGVTAAESLDFNIFNIMFVIPVGIAGTWQATLSVDSTILGDRPIDQAVVSLEEPDRIFPLYAIILIAVGCGIILIVTTIALWWFFSYKRLLKRNEENIGAGKEKEYLDNLENGVQFDENPMVGDIDDLRLQLQQNESELERLRQNKKARANVQGTIESLQEQNEVLRSEMNKLKREQQQNAVMSSTDNFATAKVKKDRKKFDEV